MDDHADLAKSFDTLLAKKNEESRQGAIERMKQLGLAPKQAAASTGTAPAGQAQPAGYQHPRFARNPYDDVLSKQFADQPKSLVEHQNQTSTLEDNGGVAQPHFNPYPNAIHQKVVQPYHVPEPITSDLQPLQKIEEPKPTKPLTQTVSPDIMRLARNNDLSISAIAHEAQRLQEGDEGEVVIKLH
jgi:hypothetical protein